MKFSMDRYDRAFWTIDVRVDAIASGGATLTIARRCGDRSVTEHVGLSPATLALLAGSGAPPAAMVNGHLGRSLRRLIKEQSAVVTTLVPYGLGGPRLAVDIRDDDLVKLNWESALEQAAAGRVAAQLDSLGCPMRVVRVVPTPPRAADRPQSLPLRFLQVGRRRGRASLHDLFGPAVWVGVAVEIESTSPRGIDEWRRTSKWPSAGVVHISTALPATLSSTALDAAPLTLGWLSRHTASLQTRLVVFDCVNIEDTQRARLLATKLAARGGPASLLVPHGLNKKLTTDLVRNLYHGLVHSEALDVLVATQRGVGIAPLALIGGVGREDLLLLTNIIADLTSLTELPWEEPQGRYLAGKTTLVTTIPTGSITADWWSATRRMRTPTIRTSALGPEGGGAKSVGRRSLPNLKADIGSEILTTSMEWDYRFSEMEGAIPATEAIRRVRTRFGINPVIDPTAPLVDVEPKFVNPQLAAPAPDGVSTPIPREFPALDVGELYFVHVDVGPQSENSAAFELTPFQELDLTNLEGTWVEIGITGLDFDVEGPLTRELHVPYGNINSDSVAFAVRPRRVGVSRLRYSIYINQNLVRSYILAARTRGPGAPPGSARDLAVALGAPLRKVGKVGWVVRLEYSTTHGFTRAQPERALSIIANHNDTESTITVKGVDTFGVMTSTTLPDLTQSIREALDEVSKPPRSDIIDPRFWPYGFNDDNSGDDTKLEQHLCTLADLGWELYSKTIADNDGVERSLERDGSVIHVAAMLRDEIVPWAVMYDRKYDAGQDTDDAGRPVEHRACLAALPKPDGLHSAVRCGDHPDCLLDPTRAGDTPHVVSTTVACPRHFWGFRHVIELPPQTTAPSISTASDDTAAELAMTVDNAVPVRVTAAGHGGLSKQADHFRQLANDLKNAAFTGPIYDRQSLITALTTTDADIVYFYCHAEPSGKGRRNPVLLLRTVVPGKDREIRSQDLDGGPRWSNRPLVFLNACRTGGFRPDSISPFIDTLITKRGGGALIATEIVVFEQLASKVSEWLLADFAANEQVGPILLRIRRRLLAQRNVLGLAYSLYGASELHLAR